MGAAAIVMTMPNSADAVTVTVQAAPDYTTPATNPPSSPAPTQEEVAAANQVFVALADNSQLLPAAPVNLTLPNVWQPSEALTTDQTTSPTGGNGAFANLPPTNPQVQAAQGGAATTNTPPPPTVNATAPSGSPAPLATAPSGPVGLIGGTGTPATTASPTAPTTNTSTAATGPTADAVTAGHGPSGSPGGGIVPAADPPAPQPTVQFTQTAFITPEGAQTSLTVSLSASSTQTVTVQYATASGTAQSGVDYTNTSGTLTFTPGTTTQTITVPGLDDGASGEVGETFTVGLSNPTNATLGQANTAMVSITEDSDGGSQPTVQLSQSTYTSTEGSPTQLTVTLSAASSQSVSVQYATQDGTARAGVDYTATSGTLTFPPNTISEPLAVPGLDDGGSGESNENFSIALSNPSNATLGTPNVATANITEDNEGSGGNTVFFAAPSYTANEGSQATIGVQLGSASSQAVTVDYATSDGTARAGTDYTTSTGTLTFAPNTTYASFSVPTLDDNGTDESNETINLTLSNPSGATITGPNPAVLNITEDTGQLSWSGMPTFTWTPTPTPPPTITNPGSQTAAEGANVALQIQATDPNNYPLTYDAVDLPVGLTINATTGEISGTVDYQAAEDFGGSYQTTVIASNGHGGSSSQTFGWTITDTPRLPVLTSPGDQTNSRGDNVSLQLTASQPDGDALVYDASNLPPGLSIDSSSGAITGTIDPSAAVLNTPYVVTATATDEETGLVASQTFNWTVSAANQPPTLTSPGDQSNAAGDTVDVPLTASDPDGDPLTFTAANLPAGLGIDPNTGEITGTIANSAASATPYSVTLLASDGSASSSVTISWAVGSVGLTNPGDQSSVAGDVVSLQLAGYSATGATLTYGASNLPPGLSIDPNTGVVSGTLPASAASANPYAVTVTASDGTTTSSQTFNWTVAALALANPGDQDNVEGSAVSLQLSGTDVGGTPTYSATGLPPGLTVNANTGLVSGAIGTAAHGSSPYQVTFTITDGTNSASQSVVWTVTPRVALVNPGPQGNAAGDTVSLPITATSTQGATLIYSATNLPPGLSINGTTGTISGTLSSNASSGSPYPVTVTASDGTSSSSQTFAWTVSPIYVPSPGDQTNLDGDSVSLSLAASYHGSGTLSYSATGLPSGLSINTSTGQVTGTIAGAADTDSPYAVTVTATDGTNTTTQAFNWTVNALVSADPVDDQTNAVGDAVSLQLTDTDALNNVVTWSSTGLPPGVSIGSSTGLLTGTVSLGADSGSPYAVTVTAADGTISSSQTFNWTITHLALANPGPQYSGDGATVALALQGGDADGDHVSYSATNLPPGLSINPSTGQITGTLTATADAGGPYLVTVSDTDGTFTTPQTFLWNVTQVGLSNPGDQTNTEGDSISLQLQGSTPSGTLTYSGANLPAGVTLNPTTGLLSGTIAAGAAANGPYSTAIVASNGTTSTSQTFTWTVNPQVSVTALADQSNNEGDAVSLQVQASDAGQRALTYSADNLPTGVSINSTTGLISGTVAAGASANGPYPVTVTATDGVYSTSQAFYWMVSPTNVVTPVLADPGSQVNVNGDSVSLAVAASDPDGDSLTFTADGLPDGLNIDETTGYITGVIASDAVSTAPYTVTVSVADGNGGTASQSFAWIVNDAALSAQGASISATEGVDTGTQTVATFTAADVDLQAGDFVATVIWGDGATDTGWVTGGNGQFTVTDDHIYEEKGTYGISVIISDPNGGSATASGTATVADAPLVVTGGFDVGAVRQQPTTLTLATFTDGNPDSLSSDFTATINFGDGSGAVPATVAYAGNGMFTISGAHTYTQDGTDTATITIMDVDGVSDTTTSTVTVGDAYAGVPVTLSLAAFEDTDSTTPASSLMATIQWGDGTPDTMATITGSSGVYQIQAVSHTYATDSLGQPAGVYQVMVTIQNPEGAPLTATTNIEVVRPPLSLTVANLEATPGVPLTGVGIASFTEPDASDGPTEFRAEVSWGDGTPLDTTAVVTGAGGLFHVFGTHTYTSQGEFPISIIILQGWDTFLAAAEGTGKADAGGGKGPTIQVLSAKETAAANLSVAKWQNAFTNNGYLTPAEDVKIKANYQALDPDRFYIQVTDAKANTDPKRVEAITVSLSTRNTPAMAAYNTAPMTVTLTETGVDTGIFRSVSLILVSDKYDQKNNPQRNILVALGGKVLVTYKGKVNETSVPAVGQIHLQVNILKVKKGGDPSASNKFVLERLQIAQERWAQAGIAVTYTLNKPVDPPAGVDLSDGINMATFNQTLKKQPALAPLSAEEKALLKAFRVPAKPKDIYVYFVNYITQPVLAPGGVRATSPKAGFTYTAADSRGFGNALTIASQANPASRGGTPQIGQFVLAHEIGHVLFNRTYDQGGKDHTDVVTQLMLPGVGDVADLNLVTDPKRLSPFEIARAKGSGLVGPPK